MDLGAYNKRVVIERPGDAVDAWRQPIPGAENWLPVCHPWANIKHESGIKTIEGGAVASKVKASIRVRYRRGLLGGMRVVFGGVVYSVLAVQPDEVNREHVDLVCEVIT